MGISFIKANFKKLYVVRLQDFKLKLMQNLQYLSLFFFLYLCVCVGGGEVSFYNKGCGGRNLTIDNE